MAKSKGLPRVIQFRGVDVYAPRCEHCDSDEDTRWDILPTLAEIQDRLVWYFGLVRALCRRCERVLDLLGADAWAAREPERLAARLAELRAEAARASHQSSEEGKTR